MYYLSYSWRILASTVKHLSHCGCPKCGNTIKRTKEDFIREARTIHGDKYDYSKVEYINNRTKVCIICPIHGEFWQTPINHINNKNGCPKCGNNMISVEEFIKEPEKFMGINMIIQKLILLN